ncbi:ATP synthase I chain [Natronincola peptidivorans]|uniref:ATP synthase I chain n=1 Tax=Natronincola peptidivorans TaxID=426128 RepID=A0A1H9ZNJ4_9FIRM|nr:ATP synthase subunit I [Natronincola peptidivorans]SES83213.1 ATP synthase I chain [Natronincola peptidivorans]
MLKRNKGSDKMNPVWETQFKIIKGVLLVNSAIGVIGVFIANPPLPFLVGLLFGTIISLLNFRLLSLTLNKAVKMQPHQAQAYTSIRYMIRYLIIGLVLYISIQAEYIHVLGTIFGILSLKFVILQKELFNNKQYFKNIFKRKEAK